MPTQYNSDFAFVHIPKTAGLSVSQYIERTMGAIRQFHTRHVPLSNFVAFGGPNPTSFETILTIFRNPFEREVSQWQFWREEHERGKVAPEFERATKQTFKEFVLDDENNPAMKDQYKQIGGYYAWWIHWQGRILPNTTIIRLEDLEVGLPEITAPYRFLDTEIPKLNASKTPTKLDEIMKMYDDEMLDHMAVKYEWTFKEKIYDRPN